MLTLPTAATPAARSAGTSSPQHTTPHTAGGEVASGRANNKSGLGSYRLGWTAFVPLAPDNSSAAEDNPAAVGPTQPISKCSKTTTPSLQTTPPELSSAPHPPFPPPPSPPPHPSLRLFLHELCPKHPVQRGSSRGLIPPF